MRKHQTSIGVTEFKAKCLSLIEDVSSGKTDQVILLKRNRPVARVVPVKQETNPPLWGALKGTVTVTPGVGLTVPTGEPWGADATRVRFNDYQPGWRDRSLR